MWSLIRWLCLRRIIDHWPGAQMITLIINIVLTHIIWPGIYVGCLRMRTWNNCPVVNWKQPLVPGVINDTYICVTIKIISITITIISITINSIMIFDNYECSWAQNARSTPCFAKRFSIPHLMVAMIVNIPVDETSQTNPVKFGNWDQESKRMREGGWWGHFVVNDDNDDVDASMIIHRW